MNRVLASPITGLKPAYSCRYAYAAIIANLAIPFEVYRECEHDDTDVHLSFQVCTYSDSGVIRLSGPVYELRGYKGHSVLVFIWRDSEVFADHDNLNLSGPNLNLSLQA